ncbi:MAG: cysteine hydrolase [Actinomycetota bacterium]|nr:cysteine hydrolase [Actinomycetota bacterium]
MIDVEGKSVFTEVEEMVNPAHCALILVDMQKDFAEVGYAYDKLGVDLSMYSNLRTNLSQVLDAARRSNTMVVHIQMTNYNNRQSDSPAQIRFNMRMHGSFRGDGPPLRYTIDGTTGHQFLEGFEPKEGEFIVKKHRSSAFFGTDLDMILRSNQISTLVVTGLTTEGCVESTARDGLFNDYYVVIADDCVASDDPAQHEASMLLMRNRFDIASSEEIIGCWDDASAKPLSA